MLIRSKCHSSYKQELHTVLLSVALHSNISCFVSFLNFCCPVLSFLPTRLTMIATFFDFFLYFSQAVCLLFLPTFFLPFVLALFLSLSFLCLFNSCLSFFLCPFLSLKLSPCLFPRSPTPHYTLASFLHGPPLRNQGPSPREKRGPPKTNKAPKYVFHRTSQLTSA